MDLTDTIAPASDQLDAVDLLTGPRTFTITGVSKGNAEQPVQIALAEFPRVWRPGKSMRRVLVSCWGPDASTYVGRRVRLFCDPRVSFGGAAVGGTRIEALSHIDKAQAVPLLVSRGKSAMFTVQPLADDAPLAKPADDCTTPAQLKLLQTHYKDIDRAVRLQEASDLLGFPVESFTALSKADASRLIEYVNGPEATS